MAAATATIERGEPDERYRHRKTQGDRSVSRDHEHEELADDDAAVANAAHGSQAGVLATLTVAEVERRVTVLAPPAMSADEVAYWLDVSAVLVARAKEVRRVVEAATL